MRFSNLSKCEITQFIFRIIHVKMNLESKKLTKEHPEKVITILDKSCIV